jgi:polyhydroxyalkanoate synthesis repressor PhaR
MKPRHVITKMKGRRLYDIVTSQYVTLMDVAALVKRKEDVLVLDRQTKRDITAGVLLQIVIELENLEHADVPVLSCDFLLQVIRSDTEAIPALFGTDVEQSIRLLTNCSQDVRGADPAHLAKNFFERWRPVQLTAVWYILRCAADDDLAIRKKMADRR